MPGLFGYKQNPKTTEMFARMSAGERFGQAVGNANQSQIARDAAAVELERQRGMDDLKTQVSQAQIRNYDRPSTQTVNQSFMAAYNAETDPVRKQQMYDYRYGLAGRPTGIATKEIGGVTYKVDAINGELTPLFVSTEPNNIVDPKAASLDQLPVVPGGRTMTAAEIGKDEGVIAGALEKAKILAEQNVLGTPEAIALKEAQFAAKRDLPGVLAKSNSMLSTLTQMREHPGMSAVIGMPNPMLGGFGPLGNFPGTDAASFAALYNQFKGGVFMEAYQELKGGGQITEIEGKKAEQAQTIMSTEGIKEVDFKRALEEFIEVVIGGVKRARIAAGGDGDVSDLIAATQIDKKAALKQKWNLK